MCQLLYKEYDSNLQIRCISEKRIRKSFKNAKPFWNENLSLLWKKSKDAYHAFKKCKGNKRVKDIYFQNYNEAQRQFDGQLMKNECQYNKSFG